jgi:hypothetical protein
LFFFSLIAAAFFAAVTVEADGFQTPNDDETLELNEALESGINCEQFVDFRQPSR